MFFICSFRILRESEHDPLVPRPNPSLPCCLAARTPQKIPPPGGPIPNTPCCKLTLDKELKLDPEASFRDNPKPETLRPKP